MPALSSVAQQPISREEFGRFKAWAREMAGINLSDHKHALVMGRLACRLRHHRLATYGDYFGLLHRREGAGEIQIAVDLLTTNETHFFREARHFELLQQRVIARHCGPRPLRVWSAACSSGEEPYSIAMTLAAGLGERPWEIVASDISTRVLDRARSGHYAMARAKTIPREHLAAYCLKGTGPQEGTFLVQEKLRNRIEFMQVNLNAALPSLGEFDAIFLRNVMIYFDIATKREVVSRIVRRLRPGGLLFIGHSESLNGVSEEVKSEVVSVYRRVSP
jgi:chemotaxis protein methyltransferase CheR